MSITLVLPDHLTTQITEAAGHPLETAGVLLAAMVKSPDGETRLLGLDINWVPDGAYIERKSDRLSIASEGYVGALGEAERRNAVAIWLHTHPGMTGIPVPSPYDEEVDRQIKDLFRLRTDSDCYGTLIVSPRPKGLAFSGRLHVGDDPAAAIERIWLVGDSWRLVRSYDSGSPPLPDLFDRNVRAFGSDIQATLGDLHIAVVGAGGTGSAVAEQLVRLGVRNLLLIDVDTLSSSNVTRVYGSSLSDVGRPKVDVLRDHLLTIAPDLSCRTVQSMITMEKSARLLTGRDLVFGCTDDNAGRLVLSRLATFHLTPVIDMGILLSSDADGQLTGIDGRVTVLTPGAACLVCRNRVDMARAATELMTPEERKRLESEGYAPALGGAEPAVVTFTTSVAAAAVGELLERLIGYGPSPRPSEILIRWHDREISTNRAEPNARHYCSRDSGKWGSGNVQPFLEQVWPQK